MFSFNIIEQELYPLPLSVRDKHLSEMFVSYKFDELGHPVVI